MNTSMYRRLPLVLIYVSKTGCGACSLFQDSWKRIVLAINMRGIIFKKVVYSKESGSFPEVLKSKTFAFPCLILMTYNEYNRIFIEEKPNSFEKDEIEEIVCVLKQRGPFEKINCIVFNTDIKSGVPLPPDDLVLPDPRNITEWIAKVQGLENLWDFQKEPEIVQISTIDFNKLKNSL